jgi:hypothetical protein
MPGRPSYGCILHGEKMHENGRVFGLVSVSRYESRGQNGGGRGIRTGGTRRSARGDSMAVPNKQGAARRAALSPKNTVWKTVLIGASQTVEAVKSLKGLVGAPGLEPGTR